MAKSLFLLKRAYLAAKKYLDEDLAQFGLTAAQMDILMTLWHADGKLEMRELQNRLYVSSPTLTGVIDGLVNHQLVARHISNEDARVKQINLTGHGLALIETLFKAEKDFSARVFKDLSPEELAVLDKCLAQIATNVGSASETLSKC